MVWKGINGYTYRNDGFASSVAQRFPYSILNLNHSRLALCFDGDGALYDTQYKTSY
jgi:hypothetical protein